jgi:hypothetical protein
VAKKLPIVYRQFRSVVQYRAAGGRMAAISNRPDSQRPYLAFKVTGGLGDCLVIARFLRDLAAQSGGFDFDIYATQPAQAHWAFRSVEGLRDCHEAAVFDVAHTNYDLAGRINQFLTFEADSAVWHRLQSRPALVQAARGAIRFRPKIEPFIQNHPYMDGYLAQRAVYANRGRRDFLHAITDTQYGGDRLDLAVPEGIAQRHGLARGRYITIHNGFDPNFFTTKATATKCYPHFGAVVALLRKKWPELRFVQIGVGTSQKLPEVDLDLLNQTSMQDAAGLIRDALLHIDNEGGLVHLARCLGVNSCVVFGPTPSNYFGYAGNINIDPAFCGGCWWNNETWMDQCPRGYPAARCMAEQPPQAVAGAIDRYLIASFADRPATAHAPQSASPAQPQPVGAVSSG